MVNNFMMAIRNYYCSNVSLEGLLASSAKKRCYIDIGKLSKMLELLEESLELF